MEWKPRENCGVVGFYSKTAPNAALAIYNCLFEQYNRGHEGSGICIYADPGRRFELRKDQRPVYEAFDEGKSLTGLRGYSGIGHNRYSTRGESDLMHAQPFITEGRFGYFAIAHNGTIRNAEKLKKEMEADGERFETNSDTEVLMRLIAEGSDIIEGIRLVSREAEGSYSLTLLTKNGVYAVRDPHGIKPLCIGRGYGTTVIASESCAFNNGNGIEFDRDMERGEIFYAGPEGEHSESLGKKSRALDIFELIYFARADSVIDGINVAEYRMEIGRKLARKEFIEPDSKTIIGAVPYSGIDYAVGYQEEMFYNRGVFVPNREIFLRKRHVRSFIQPLDAKRDSAMLKKLAPKKSLIEGRKIMLLDDSTVRGTTDKKLAAMLRKAGAIEIHKRNGYAPVIDICTFGIDMKTREEHIANQVPDINERAKHLGFDSMLYNTAEDLIPEGFEINDFCTHCITGRDPIGIESTESNPSQLNLHS